MSTAAHSEALGQEIAVMWLVPSTCITVHGAALGVADVRTLPALSTATQSVVDGQEIPFSWVVPSII